MMDRLELQKLRDLPIEGVAERLGLQVKMHKALCPFHDDHHASLSFSVRRNTFRCFVCGEHGGVIDLVMKCLNMSFKEAVGWLADATTAPLSSPEGDTSAQRGRFQRALQSAHRNRPYCALLRGPDMSGSSSGLS